MRKRGSGKNANGLNKGTKSRGRQKINVVSKHQIGRA